jgi:hypothetical protein
MMKSPSIAFVILACVGLFPACSSSSGGPSGSGGSGTGTGSGSGTGGAKGGTTGTGGSATGGNGTGGSATGGNGTGGGSGGGATGGSGSATGGAAGSGPGTGGAAGGTAGGCAGLALCDNFDSQAAGAAPDSSLWTMIGAKGCSGQGTAFPFTVDSSQSHSPPNSMMVSGGDSCGPLMLNTSAFSKLTGSDVYGRFYVRLSATTPSFDHSFLMALGLTSGTFTTSNQMSFLQLASEGVSGSSTNVFMWQTSDGNILPDKNSAGGATSTYPAAATWTCVEFHTSSTGTLETWVNGNAVPGLTFIPGTTTKMSGVNDQWTAPSPFTPMSIGFGQVQFSGGIPTIWFDDIAVGSTRIGCN